MRRFVWVVPAVVAGCLGAKPDLSAFFLLSSPPGLEAGAPVPVVLGLGPVTLPGYLDRPQIVVRVSEHEVSLAESDRWAEPLRENVPRTLRENLARLLPSSSYVAYPWHRSEAPDYGITVEVGRFEADVAGAVVLDAAWWIVDAGDGGVVERRTTVVHESAAGPDRAAVVDAQSRALAALSREIAAAVRRVVGGAASP
ncbi:MAG: PqiC family protein [Gemmatimonadota bacterium]|nr:PqiC family protein [Gemmatimonadota bacterium]MDH5758423.1 PqiC family protein [Gemmatimonadota bacterium]